MSLLLFLGENIQEFFSFHEIRKKGITVDVAYSNLFSVSMKLEKKGITVDVAYSNLFNLARDLINLIYQVVD